MSSMTWTKGKNTNFRFPSNIFVETFFLLNFNTQIHIHHSCAINGMQNYTSHPCIVNINIMWEDSFSFRWKCHTLIWNGLNGAICFLLFKLHGINEFISKRMLINFVLIVMIMDLVHCIGWPKKVTLNWSKCCYSVELEWTLPTWEMIFHYIWPLHMAIWILYCW